MKYLTAATIFCIAVTLLAACSKNTPLAINGKWELRQTMSDIGVKTYNPGSGITLEITGPAYTLTDTAYAYFVGMASAKQGSCVIVHDASASETVGLVLGDDFNNRIIFNGDNTRQKAFFKQDNDTLVIVSGYFPADGGTELKLVKQ